MGAFTLRVRLYRVLYRVAGLSGNSIFLQLNLVVSLWDKRKKCSLVLKGILGTRLGSSRSWDTKEGSHRTWFEQARNIAFQGALGLG